MKRSRVEPDNFGGGATEKNEKRRRPPLEL